MTKKGITLDLKTIAFILTVLSLVASGGIAWGSLDTQLDNVTKQLAKIEATQKEHTDKLEALALSDAIVGSKIDGHVERDHP